MVSQPQLRILSWLNNHPSSLEKEWDVTRAISLPGISEGLGVVRSALSSPLTYLEQDGLITKRMAHVIGGGSRRRQVYHITIDGRQLVEKSNFVQENVNFANEILGDVPSMGEIFGREDELANCLQILESNSLIISGMPGIGKTAFAYKLIRELSKNKLVRWSTANKFADYSTICKQWEFTATMPRDVESISLKFSNKEEILILDDYNSISNRHIEKVNHLIESIAKIDKMKLIIITRELSVTLDSFENFKLGPLDINSCCSMLGDESKLSDRQNIARSLGCHPLALKLYQPEFNVPELNSDIINYVDKVVLQNLDKSNRQLVSLLSIEPFPVNSERSIIVDKIDIFDDQNLLKWYNGNKLELQHLIRNVTRSNLTDKERELYHAKLVSHWENYSNEIESNLYLYHLAQVDASSFIELLSSSLSNKVVSDSAAVAVIVNQLIQQRADDKELRYLACRISAHRFEADELRNNINYLEGSRLIEMKFKLAELDGRKEDCELMIEDLLEQFSPFQKNQFLISMASQYVDDRLPNQKIPTQSVVKAQSYLEMMDIKNLHERRHPILIAASLIRYSIAINHQDILAAEDIINSLEKVTTVNDSTVVSLRAKQAIYEFETNSKTIEETYDIVEASCQLIDNALLSESLKLKMIESITSYDLVRSSNLFSQLIPPDRFARTKTSLRYCARWWLLHAKFNPESEKSSIKESIARFRESGCHNAAKQLESQLHSLI